MNIFLFFCLKFLQVLRWSAIAAGVIAGAYNTQVLKTEGQKKQEAFDFAEKTKLINEAKAEYAKLHPKKEVASTEINLEDPNLDFAQVILGAVEKLGN